LGIFGNPDIISGNHPLASPTHEGMELEPTDAARQLANLPTPRSGGELAALDPKAHRPPIRQIAWLAIRPKSCLFLERTEKAVFMALSAGGPRG
jgi:hypothetical protein